MKFLLGKVEEGRKPMKKAKILSITLVCLLALVCLLSGCSLLQALGDETVHSGYFEFASVERSEGADTSTLSVTSSCPLPIYKYRASLIFVDAFEQEFYETDTITKEVEIPANEQFKINFVVSNELVTRAISFKLKIQGTSKERLSSLEDTEYNVTFRHGGRVIETQSIEFGKSPILPEMEWVGNEYFDGWYKDEALQNKIDPSKQKIYRDTTYYAKYTPDLNKVSDQIHKEGIPCVVTINTTQEGYTINGYQQVMTQGSGVIVKIEGSTAYVLTNAHVVHSAGLGLKDATITDCLNRTYQAKVSKNASGLSAIKTSYDLALMEFTLIDDKPMAVKISTTNPQIGDAVVAVGTPEGVRNSVTYGECVTYQKAQGQINLDFQVLWHDADITHGSSGGALFNSNCQLVGINYAGTSEADGGYGMAIPIAKVREFISQYTRITLE